MDFMVIVQGGTKRFLKLEVKPGRIWHNGMSFCGQIALEAAFSVRDNPRTISNMAMQGRLCRFVTASWGQSYLRFS
jgi:hypothetical protein